jgi:hypothetical protein
VSATGRPAKQLASAFRVLAQLAVPPALAEVAVPPTLPLAQLISMVPIQSKHLLYIQLAVQGFEMGSSHARVKPVIAGGHDLNLISLHRHPSLRARLHFPTGSTWAPLRCHFRWLESDGLPRSAEIGPEASCLAGEGPLQFLGSLLAFFAREARSERQVGRCRIPTKSIREGASPRADRHGAWRFVPRVRGSSTQRGIIRAVAGIGR